YLKNGLQPVPVPERSKGPILPEWQHFSCALDAVHLYFSSGANIGLLLGARSHGLCDIDLDVHEACVLAPHFLPPTEMRSGRPGRPSSHWWYLVSPFTFTNRKFQCRFDVLKEAKTIVEVRGTGLQTLVPPSVHPEGDRYTWESFHPPTPIAEA